MKEGVFLFAGPFHPGPALASRCSAVAADQHADGVEIGIRNRGGIQESLLKRTLNVYPNPSTSKDLRLQIISEDSSTPITLSIIDLNGKVQYKSVLNGLGSDQPLGLNKDLPSGIYYLIVQQGEQVSKKKVVIK